MTDGSGFGSVIEPAIKFCGCDFDYCSEFSEILNAWSRGSGVQLSSFSSCHVRDVWNVDKGAGVGLSHKDRSVGIDNKSVLFWAGSYFETHIGKSMSYNTPKNF